MKFRNLDINLVRTFVTVAEAKNFSRAAEQLSRNQSTISLQIKRLEDVIGQQLFDRSPRAVRLTAHGEVLLSFAQDMLKLNDEVVSRINEPLISGMIKLGTPEDFATTYLPEVLARFRKAYPLVSLEVTCDLTLNLLKRFREGAFDLALVKQEPTKGGGKRVWREPLVWVAADGYSVPKSETLQLVVSPEPCVYRKRALQALKRVRRLWHITYTCASLAGTQAAVRAGLGITVLPKAMVPDSLKVIDVEGLPDLRDTEIALLSARPLTKSALRLQEHIVKSLESPRARGR